MEEECLGFTTVVNASNKCAFDLDRLLIKSRFSFKVGIGRIVQEEMEEHTTAFLFIFMVGNASFMLGLGTYTWGHNVTVKGFAVEFLVCCLLL